MTQETDRDGEQGMGASADAETGSHPTGQAELHRLGASRFDPERGQAAINISAGIYLDVDGLAFPITNWFDEDGEECPREDAVTAVAGEGGCWFSLVLADFSEAPCRA